MLSEKVLQLKLNGAVALRHALWWEKQIHVYGEHKATEFYKHLGLNHLETKAFEFEGLQLSREPTPAERLCVKAVAQTQDSAKDQLGALLLALRTELIHQGLLELQSLKPATYHTLVLTPSINTRQVLRERLTKIYRQGRSLVAAELSRKQADEDDDELDEIADLTGARVANDVQARLTGSIQRLALLGLATSVLFESVSQEMADGSVVYIDRVATGAANKVINLGRAREARIRRYGRVEYSAILDQNVCGPCASEDGQQAADEADLTPAPNPDCEGGDWCRCFHVFIQD